MRKNNQLTKSVIFITAVTFAGTILVSCGGDDDDSGQSVSGANKSNSGGSNASYNQGGSSAATGTSNTTAAATCVKTINCGGNACSTEGLSSGIPIVGNMMCISACCTSDDKCGSSTQMTNMGAFAGMFGMGTQQQAAPVCIEQNQPGLEDANCPKFLDNIMQQVQQGEDAGGNINLGQFGGQMGGLGNMQGMFDQMNFKGCCRADGKCGYMVTASNLGCILGSDLINSFGIGGMLGGNMPLGNGNNTGTTTPKTCVPQ